MKAEDAQVKKGRDSEKSPSLQDQQGGDFIIMDSAWRE